RHLAEKGDAATEPGNAGRGIGGAAAGGLDRRAHALVEQLGALAVDEAHRPARDAVCDQEVIIAARDDVDDRVADAQHIRYGHTALLSFSGSFALLPSAKAR